jgi:signal transduction histidine kinase/CheY-like chemotaxis protein/HPt (histidine-containing phosphotransfer) domain-containing protein
MEEWGIMKIITIVRENLKLLLFIFFSFLVMFLAYYFLGGNIVESYISSTSKAVLATRELEIKSELRDIEVGLHCEAFSIRDYIQSGASLEMIEQYMMGMSTWLTSPEINLRWFADFYGYINGQYIDAKGWKPTEDYHPTERPWYKAAYHNPGIIVYTAPYNKFRTGSLIVTVARTIDGPGGKDYGVVCMDLILDEILKTVTKDGYGWIVGEDYRFIAHPDSFYVGKSLEEIPGNFMEIARALESGNLEIAMFDMTNHKDNHMMEFVKRMENGWIIGIATPWLDYNSRVYIMGVVLGVIALMVMVVLCYSLVKLGVAKHQSDDENKSKTSFLARMSHEIRTPLNSILGMSELISRQDLSAEVYEYTSIIRQSGNALLGIINDILDFSKIDSGHLVLKSSEYSFASLMNDVINVIRIRLVEKPLDFFVSVDGHIPATLIGDEVRVRQILINLLNNAIKYTPKGFISLSVEKQSIDAKKIKLIFKVSDSGIGINHHDMGILFDEFTRLDLERNQGIEGSGLGLTIANVICKAMDGAIEVSSTYGKGSVFTASITQTFEDTQCGAEVANPEQKRVLLYENRPGYANSFTTGLVNLGLAPPVCSPNLPAFLADLESGDYNYAFVSSKYAVDSINVWRKRRAGALIIMVELGEISTYRETSSILLPVYANTLADILNGVITERGLSQDDQIRIVIPSARILIVDDIETNLRIAVGLMAPYDMKIDTAMNGPEAIRMIQKNSASGFRYDLVFMDHMMPGMDGIEAAAKIRNIDKNDKYYRELPIVMFTANVLSDQQELFLHSGINDFLAKPIEMKKLNAILEKWIPREKQVERDPELDAVAERKEFPWIAGVDTWQGLQNAGGSSMAYIDVLSVFCRDARGRAEEIGEATEKGDMARYIILVHALKGASWSIGATKLGGLAEELEGIGRNWDLAAVEKKTATFLEQLRNIIANIAVFLNWYNNEDEKTGTIDLSALGLQTLKEALLALDIASVNAFMKACRKRSLNTGAREFMRQVEEYILLFEYEKAIACINTVIDSPSGRPARRAWGNRWIWEAGLPAGVAGAAPPWEWVAPLP